MTAKKKSTENDNQLTLPSILETAGTAASLAAAKFRFEDYRSRLSVQTVRRQDADLVLFAEFLHNAEVRRVGAFNEDPEAWRGVSWGLVEAFVKWQLKEGYAVSSVNVRLSTVKSYARLAFQAGTLSAEAYALIRSVQGYARREKRRIDARRLQTRVGLKKETPVTLSPEQAAALKNQPLETAQGARDALVDGAAAGSWSAGWRSCRINPGESGFRRWTAQILPSQGRENANAPPERRFQACSAQLHEIYRFFEPGRTHFAPFESQW